MLAGLGGCAGKPEAEVPVQVAHARPLFALASVLGLALLGSGCSFGPKVLERSHWRYNESVRRVYEEQLLQNIIRMRYNEFPFRLNVSSIAAQYELTGSAEARPFFVAPNPASHPYRTFTSVLPDVAFSGANRPTITFLPESADSVRRYLTPITADTLVFLATTSWPVSTVIRLWAERLNGVPNAVTASGPQRGFAPDFERFQRIASLMQVAQDLELAMVTSEERAIDAGGPFPTAAINGSAALDAAKNGFEYRPRGDGTSCILLRKDHKLVLETNPAALNHPVLNELADLLHLEPGRRHYDLVVSSEVPDPLRFPRPRSQEVLLTPRSTAQVHFFLANGVEVPPEHIAAGLARTPLAPDGTPFDPRAVTAGLFTVHAWKGHKPPPDAHIAVKYRGYWFYIDDRDQASKQTFSLTLELLRLDFGAQDGVSGPFLTLPVGR
jgi:hypothetical protein